MTNMNRFNSAIEEAISLAYETREKIIEGKHDIISILLKCAIIASNTKKEEDEKWILYELEGYWDVKPLDFFPDYRQVKVFYSPPLGKLKEKKFMIQVNIQKIQESLDKDEMVKVEVDNNLCIIPKIALQNIMVRVSNRCFYFLNTIIKEFQYGGLIENLMEDIRLETDKKLLQLDVRIAKEVESLQNNLTSDNPADWNKVGHSCRSILKLIADKVYFEKDSQNEPSNGVKHAVTSDKYLNRLMAFLDTKEKDSALMKTEIELLKNNLYEVNEKICTVEHNLKAQKLQAKMVAIRTYLIISEILRYVE